MLDQNLLANLQRLKTEYRQMDYNWRDVALYALAVGAHPEDLIYFYEKGLKAIPTFGTLPCWSAIHTVPRIPAPFPVSFMIGDMLGDRFSSLQMEQELVIHRPIDPIKGTFIYQDKVSGVYDRGPGKGLVVASEMQVFDEAGAPVCTNRAATLFKKFGGFGGPPLPKAAVEIPACDPDFEVGDYIGKTQNILFRLTGDTNLVHVDPSFAVGLGYERPFMQGLCLYGYACRMAISCLTPGEPERMRHMYAQMRSVTFPDTHVKMQIWTQADGLAYFRLINTLQDVPILDRGIFEWV